LIRPTTRRGANQPILARLALLIWCRSVRAKAGAFWVIGIMDM
jgi:hypothetical protein